MVPIEIFYLAISVVLRLVLVLRVGRRIVSVHRVGRWWVRLMLMLSVLGSAMLRVGRTALFRLHTLHVPILLLLLIVVSESKP